MSPPTVAAIIPVYNRPTVVLEALASVAAQTRPPDVLVIVDDGSTDGTVGRIDAWFAANRPAFPVRVVRQANAGAAAARNRGAREAGDHELLAFLDSDDLWPADYLARMTDAFSDQPDVVAATCDIIKTGPSLPRERRYTYEWARGRVTGKILVLGITGTPNTVIRRDAYQRAGGQCESLPFAEDRHLFLRVSLLGDWAYVPGAPVINRIDHAANRGEEGHLGFRHADSYRVLAQMMERFVAEEGGRGAVSPRECGDALSLWWFKAGRQLEASGRRGEAHDCYRRSLRWRHGKLKAWWRALVTLRR